MTLTLAITTSTRQAGVALLDDDDVRFVRRESPAAGHSRDLTRVVEEALGAAGKRLREVDAFAVDVGPGSFTGLRIGLATVRTWAWTLGIPAFGATSLDVMTHAAAAAGQEGDLVAALLLSRRGEHYVRADRVEATGLVPALAPCLLEEGEIARTLTQLARGRVLLCGELPAGDVVLGASLATAGLEAIRLSPTHDAPDPLVLARLARDRALPAEPVYLALSEAERKALIHNV